MWTNPALSFPIQETNDDDSDESRSDSDSNDSDTVADQCAPS